MKRYTVRCLYIQSHKRRVIRQSHSIRLTLKFNILLTVHNSTVVLWGNLFPVSSVHFFPPEQFDRHQSYCAKKGQKEKSTFIVDFSFSFLFLFPLFPFPFKLCSIPCLIVRYQWFIIIKFFYFLKKCQFRFVWRMFHPQKLFWYFFLSIFSNRMFLLDVRLLILNFVLSLWQCPILRTTVRSARR